MPVHLLLRPQRHHHSEAISRVHKPRQQVFANMRLDPDQVELEHQVTVTKVLRAEAEAEVKRLNQLNKPRALAAGGRLRDAMSGFGESPGVTTLAGCGLTSACSCRALQV
jgi:hypothetical protein